MNDALFCSLAGSERYTDTKLHSRERLEENKETNKSLMALKDCVRARARAAESGTFVHIPYRANRLTLLLKVGHKPVNLTALTLH